MNAIRASLTEASSEDLFESSTEALYTLDYRPNEEAVTGLSQEEVERQSVLNYLDALRPFWWLYLALLFVLALMIFYVKKDVILERCRKKDPRDQITRLDVSAFNVEILVTCRPPPSYEQAMGLSPQGPPPHELPPKHPPLPDDVKMAETFNVWFG